MDELELIEMKNGYEQQIADLKKQNEQLQAKHDRLIATHAIKEAFLNAGGIDDFTLDINPLDLVTDFVSSKVKVENEKLIFLDRNGQRESINLDEKIAQIKRGMPSLFDRQQSNPKLIGNDRVVYSIEQARSGKADMAKIASGRAVVS